MSIQLMAAFKSVLVEENKAVYAHVNTVPEQSREGTKGLLSAGSGSLSNSTSHVSILKKPACPPIGYCSNGREGDVWKREDGWRCNSKWLAILQEC